MFFSDYILLFLANMVAIVVSDSYMPTTSTRFSGNFTIVTKTGSPTDCAFHCSVSRSCEALTYNAATQTCELLPADHYAPALSTSETTSDWIYYINLTGRPKAFLNEAGDKICMQAEIPEREISPDDKYYCFKAPLAIEDFNGGKTNCVFTYRGGTSVEYFDVGYEFFNIEVNIESSVPLMIDECIALDCGSFLATRYGHPSHPKIWFKEEVNERVHNFIPTGQTTFFFTICE